MYGVHIEVHTTLNSYPSPTNCINSIEPICTTSYTYICEQSAHVIVDRYSHVLKIHVEDPQLQPRVTRNAVRLSQVWVDLWSWCPGHIEGTRFLQDIQNDHARELQQCVRNSRHRTTDSRTGYSRGIDLCIGAWSVIRLGPAWYTTGAWGIMVIEIVASGGRGLSSPSRA